MGWRWGKSAHPAAAHRHLWCQRDVGSDRRTVEAQTGQPQGPSYPEARSSSVLPVRPRFPIRTLIHASSFALGGTLRPV